MFYYAYIDSTNTVTGVYALPSAITADGYISITEQQYNDSIADNENSLIGKVYNAETGEFEDPIPWSGSSDQVQYKDTTQSVSAKLDEIDAAISDVQSDIENLPTGGTIDAYTKTETDTLLSAKANTTDLHTHENKTVLDGITAAKVSQWDSNTGGGTAGADGADGVTFIPSVSSAGVISWTNDGGLENPTPVNIKGADGTNGTDGADGADGTTVVVGTTTTGDAGTNASVTGTLNSETNTLTLNFTIPKGADGADGADGASGTEITAAQVLEKIKTVDGQNSGLDADMLDGHDTDYFATATQLANKADADHTHSGYAATTHTHSMDDVTGLSSALNGKASTDHTHSGYASSSHTHSQSEITGLTSALNGKASTSHTHSEYASASHTHSGYASSSHTHTSFSSAIDVSGAIKSNGVQVGYNSGTDTTLGSNNYHTIVAGSYVTLNGEKTYAPNIYPRNTGSFDLGAQSNRWSNIYSKTALNVSSDERLKENIIAIDENAATKLINDIDVVSFNYIDDDTPQIGIIAQDILLKSPEMAKYLVTQGNDGYYGVKTSDLVFPLIKAVQTLARRVEEFERA